MESGSRFVFGPVYKAAIARTPEIRPTLGTRDMVYLGLYLVLAVAAIGLHASKLA